MIQAVIFDCFGVLYHGSTAHLNELTPIENRQELHDLRLAADRGYVTQNEFIKQAAMLIGQTTDELRQLLATDHVRDQQLLDYLEKFIGSYKIALLSNIGRDVIHELFSAEELAHYFDVVVLSSDVGMVKPYPEIFEYTADQLRLSPGECVMIDDLTVNIDGAKAVGMQGIVYHTRPQLAHELHRLGVRHA